MAAWLTVAEYRAAPTSVDTSALVAGGNQAAQDAELAQVIRRASDWCESFTNNVGAAQVRSTTERAWFDQRDGDLVLHPGTFPLVSLTALRWGATPASLTTVSDLSAVWVDEQVFRVPFYGGSATAIDLSRRPVSGRVVATYSYVAGWPNTTLTATAIAGAGSITVASSVGMVAGTVLTIVDGANTEQVTVASVNGSTVTLSGTLANAHSTTGVAVHAVPADLKMAAILATSAFLRNRGSESLVMGSLGPPGVPIGSDPVASNDLRLAKQLLSAYTRVL